ncbi:hypothetical protein [Goodfellowiella coeruleoviolacea]|uniref:PepSY domain-containing protein n=1 Tax=Goodfellowiella coeruleoviolacea TaxID=334858 RepID=A0AAE3G9N6_9PSEU|nr:hypothetical protein [Goodfellowiella coeruleoviolacea]MCP2164221.1 hypothetical protein [Goodfellowiella coeruleoviolacea]
MATMLSRMLRLIAVVAMLITVPAPGQAAASGEQPRGVFTFGKLAEIVTATVQYDHPDAVWTRAWADTPAGAVDSVGSWHFAYRAQVGGEPATIRAEANLDGLIGLLKVVREPAAGDAALALPVVMEPGVADALLTDAGYRAPYRAVVLRRPAGFVVDDPWYVFEFGDGEQVGVDTWTGEVRSIG